MHLPQIRTSSPEPHSLGEHTAPQELVAWGLRRFKPQRIVATTQFGMEGCALIDMLARTGRQVTVVYLDTHFFFRETYALRDLLVQRYPTLEIVNRGTSLTPEQQAATHGPELWKSNPNLCCRLRKVEPMQTVLRGVDLWITGIRRDQSATRAQTRILEWDWRFEVLKFSPLAYWSRADVWDYIRANDVPFNPLHEREYPSIGCTHCTTPVPGSNLGSYSRDGRWSGDSKSECGLHQGSNI